MLSEYVKHLLIRTPLEGPSRVLQRVLKFGQRWRHPELREIYVEPLRIKQVMRRVIHESSNCIDVGCHLGSTLSQIVKLAPRGRHLAFEPLPHKRRWLIQKFPEVDVRQLALSDTSGEATFHYCVSRSGCSALRPRGISTERVKEVTVTCEQLDTVIPHDHRVDFIKIDVEGGELAVLRGAQETLRCHNPTLLFECTRQGLRMFDCKPADVVDFLTKQHCYSIFLLKDFLTTSAPLDLRGLENALDYPFQAHNLLAVPKDALNSAQG